MTSNQLDLNSLRNFWSYRSRIHGVRHWAHVSYLGKKLGELTRLDRDAHSCIQAFAWCHDLWRDHDGSGNTHGQVGAQQFRSFNWPYLEPLCSEARELVACAIYYHSDGLVAEDAFSQGLFEGIKLDPIRGILIVGCCWDADRLDLLRLGIEPDPDLFSTPRWDSVLDLAERINGM